MKKLLVFSTLLFTTVAMKRINYVGIQNYLYELRFSALLRSISYGIRTGDWKGVVKTFLPPKLPAAERTEMSPLPHP